MFVSPTHAHPRHDGKGIDATLTKKQSDEAETTLLTHVRA